MKPCPDSGRWPSFVFAILLIYIVPVFAHQAADEMAAAANKLVASFDPAQKTKAVLEFQSEDRFDWHFVPKERKGLTLKEMSTEQRRLAHALLQTGFSDHGYNKATNILNLEPVLAEMEGPNRRFPRDPELYHILIFGKPEAKGTWGWRVEGHHLSANFTIIKGEFFGSTPSFFGSNPAEVRQGPRTGTRVLAGEEDRARELMQSLSAEQRQVAIYTTKAPGHILTEAKRRVQPLESVGIMAAQFTPAQRDFLLKVIEEYVSRVRPELADEDLKKINQAGLEKVQFAWAGGIEKGQQHYYRVQGPTFLLEYDNTQNNANHIHAVWRDFANDFGEDLLRKHYAEQPHGN